MSAHALIGMRGQRLLLNGRFETNATTSWSAVSTPATFEATGDRAHVVGDSAGDGMGQAVALVLGKKYRLSLDYQVVSGVMNFGKTGMPSVANLSGNGTYVLHFVESDGASRTFAIQVQGASGEWYADNIKLQRAF